MRAIRYGTAASIVLALATATNASGQTVNDATSFFADVVTNGATQVIPTMEDSVHTFSSDRIFIPGSVTTNSCSSKIKAIGTDANDPLVTVNWSKIIDFKGFYTDTTKPGIVIIGGTWSSSYRGPVPGLILQTNSKIMDIRLIKAINMIVKSCAKSSHGF